MTKKLKKSLMNSIKKLMEKMGKSFENTMYLMHHIIYNLQMEYTSKWGGDPMPGFTDSSKRDEFEQWLVDKCIHPVTQNHESAITKVQSKVSSSPKVLMWSKRFGGQVDLVSEHGRGLAKGYL